MIRIVKAVAFLVVVIIVLLPPIMDISRQSAVNIRNYMYEELSTP